MINQINEIPQRKYGLLIGEDIKLYRDYFIEMCNLIGINVKVKTPIDKSKQYTTVGEIKSNYNNPIIVGAIYDEYPNQKTLRKAGWAVELDETESVIHLPYGIEGLQKGTLIEIPSAIEGAKDRTFRVKEMSTIMIYPASIACVIAPEFENTLPATQVNDFVNTNFNLLREPKEFDWARTDENR